MDKSEFVGLVKQFGDAGKMKSKVATIEAMAEGFKKFDPQLANIYSKFVEINREIHEYCKGKLEK